MRSTNRVKYRAAISGQAVVLIGFMGCGKTHVGKLLARRLRAHFVDLDQLLVARAGDSIAHVFKKRGEAGFRRLESAVLKATVKPGRVYAAGGGMPMRASNRKILRSKKAFVVWLDPGWVAIRRRLKRLNARSRPLLWDAKLGRARPATAIRELYLARLGAYAACANLRLRVPARERPAGTASRLAGRLAQPRKRKVRASK